MAKLVQVLAIEKGIKNRQETLFTQFYQTLTKLDLFNGFSRTYQPKDDTEQALPPENKVVQLRVEDGLKQLKAGLTELFDVTAQRDATNCVAKADVVVDGAVLLKDVPATHLLFIEKKLTDLLNFAKKLPTLAQDEKWHRDEALGVFATDPVRTTKTRKVIRHVVVVPPTKEHPAQVKDDAEDINVGEWSTVKFSGALPADRVMDMVARVEKLTKAVKYAREEANTVQVVDLKTGDAILSYIFDQ